MGTNKKATGPRIKNNTDVNQSNAKMNEYIYISRSRSLNVHIQNAGKMVNSHVLEQYIA